MGKGGWKLVIAVVIAFLVLSGIREHKGHAQTKIEPGTVLWTPEKYTEAQLEFTARRFASLNIGGSSPEKKSEYAKKIHSYSRMIKIFSYMNSRQVPNTAHWNSIWLENPDLFARDENGNRIKNTVFDQWLMNVENPEWVNGLVDRANRHTSDMDGIFLDNAKPTLGSSYSGKPAGYVPDRYAQQMKNMLSTIKRQVSGLVIFNGLSKGIKYSGYAESVDGALAEGFIFSASTQEVSVKKVEDDMNAVLKAATIPGYLVGVASKSYMTASDKRMFAVVGYLLVCKKDVMTYNFMDLNHRFSEPLQYYPEYDIDLGSPLGPPPVDVHGLLDPATNLAIRRFERGMVVANPWDYSIKLTLDRAFRKVVMNGGGSVNAHGEWEGSLTYEDVWGPVVVPAESAMILVKK